MPMDGAWPSKTLRYSDCDNENVTMMRVKSLAVLRHLYS